VWWDADVEAGSSFANDIARELEASDVIVVVWSATSITSAWVLDEAGVGRDRGRLVPILIDPVKPPLGFRQLNVVNLSGWRGGQADPRLAKVIAAVKSIAEKSPSPTPAQPTARALRLRWVRPWIAVPLVLMVALAIGSRFLTPHRPKQSILAVLPFTDISAAKGQAYFAEGLAEEIQDTLARDGRLKVLGSATARAIRDKSGDPAFARNRLGVTRLLEGSVRTDDAANSPRVKVSVRLIDTQTGFETWSQSFEGSGKDVISIQEAVAEAVDAQISGSLAGNPSVAPSARKVAPEAYEKIIIARQLIRARQADSLQRARDVADEAIAIAPDYAPAYAARADAVMVLTQYGGVKTPALSQARRDAEMAIQLDPGLSDGYAALSLSLWFSGDVDPAIEAAQRAIARRPGNAEAHLHLAYFLSESDQPNRAITEFAAAAALDPLWRTAVASLIANYALTNRPSSARAAAKHYRSISLESADADFIDGVAEIATGNIGRAILLFKASIRENPKLSSALLDIQLFRRELIEIEGGNTETNTLYIAKNFAASRGLLNDSTSVQSTMQIWDDPIAASDVASSLIVAGRVDRLLEGYDARFASPAGFASATPVRDRSAVVVALALERAGRKADARALLDLARRRLTRYEAGGLAPSRTSVDWAGLLTEEGDRVGAIARLRSGFAAQWWPVCQGPFWLGDLPTLEPLRGDARFEAILAQCRLRINTQRAIAGMKPLAFR